MVIVIQSKISDVLSQCTKAGSLQKVGTRVSTIVDINILWMGDADLCLYITAVQDG
jgi:hypothetical protein